MYIRTERKRQAKTKFQNGGTHHESKLQRNRKAKEGTGRSHRNLTGDKTIYKFMPTCAFEIGDITVSKRMRHLRGC